jgi:hypothetical protein
MVGVPELLFLVFWLGGAFAVSQYAAKVKGREYWFLWSLLLSPLIAFIIVAILPAQVGGATNAFRKCPACAETVRAEAKICRFCRSELPGAPDQIAATKAILDEAAPVMGASGVWVGIVMIVAVIVVAVLALRVYVMFCQ